MQFEEWNATLRQTCGHYYGVPERAREAMAGHFRSFRAHGMDVADLACDIDRIERTPEGIRRDESEYLFLVLQKSGRSHIEHQGRSVVLGQGDAFLLDSTRTAQIRFDGRHAHLVSLHMPRGMMLLEAEGGLRTGVALRAHEPVVAMLRDCLDQPARRGAEVDSSFLFDLVRMAFAPEAACLDGSRMAGGANRYELAVRTLEANLFMPDLSLAWLARRTNISRRQLQRDFLARGTSFVRMLRARRLALAAEMMTVASRLNPSMTITEIAFGSGFNDISNFNRAFRQRYDCAPGDYLRRCAR